MLNLGGSIMGFSSADSSSAAKGESVSDTIRTISCYADICAMRHPKEGAPMVASQHSSIPVINAGDGGHQHPTQTLTAVSYTHLIQNILDAFFLRVMDKAAGIDHDHIRLCLIIGHLVPFFMQKSKHKMCIRDRYSTQRPHATQSSAVTRAT